MGSMSVPSLYFGRRSSQASSWLRSELIRPLAQVSYDIEIRSVKQIGDRVEIVAGFTVPTPGVVVEQEATSSSHTIKLTNPTQKPEMHPIKLSKRDLARRGKLIFVLTRYPQSAHSIVH